MIRNIFYTATQSIFPRNEKKKKKEFRWFIQRLQISLLYNDSFLEIFLRFSMPRRIVINPEKNNIKLWTKSIFVSKKKVCVEKEEKNREK